MGYVDDGHLDESHRIPVAVAIWAIAFLQNFVIKSMGVLLPVLLEQFATPTRNVGVIVSLIFFSGNLIGLSAQPLKRIIGARIIIISCGILSSIGLLISSLASSLSILVIGMLFTGFLCMGNTLALGLISSYFTTNYSAATNIITTALPASIIVSAPMTQLFIDMYGWRGAMLISCSLNLHFIAAAAVLKPVKLSKTNYKGISYKTMHTDQSDVKNRRWKHIYKNFKDTLNVSFLKNGSFLVVLIVSMVTGYTLNGWVVYLVSIAQSKGLSSSNAATVATIGGVGALLIRIVLAVAQGKDTYYRHYFIIGALLAIVSYGGMYFASSFWIVSLYSFILGVSFGILGSQAYIAVKTTVDHKDAVGAVAWINLTSGVGYITSGYVSGWLYDLEGTFNLALIAQCIQPSGIFVVLGAEYLWSLLT